MIKTDGACKCLLGSADGISAAGKGTIKRNECTSGMCIMEMHIVLHASMESKKLEPQEVESKGLAEDLEVQSRVPGAVYFKFNISMEHLL